VMAVLLPTIMGDFVDLSLGSSLGLSAMTLAVLNVQHNTPIVIACLAGIGAALLVGLINVFFVVFFDNDPFIVTLGTMTIVQGVIYIISGDNSVGIVSPGLSNWVFSNDFLSIPLEFYYGLAIFLVVWYVLSFTPVGQKALVIGQSREVARLTGIRVDRQRSWAFIIGAGIAGVAGIAYAGTNGTVDPTAGSTLILPAFAAVFLGVTAIKPGRINALGALIAVYFLATGTAGLELLGTQSYLQQIFYGTALVAAITIPKATRDRFFKRKRTAA
jgi:ribose transport system permease protein